MTITETEFKSNLGKYLQLAMVEDILITQYGKVIARLTKPFENRADVAESLFGVLPQVSTFDEVREDRLADL